MRILLTSSVCLSVSVYSNKSLTTREEDDNDKDEWCEGKWMTSHSLESKVGGEEEVGRIESKRDRQV